MVIHNNWFRLVLYFIFWIVCSIPFYILIFKLFPSAFNGSKADYTLLLENNLIFLAVNQVASVCGIFLATYLMVKTIEKRNLRDIKLTINFFGLLKGLLLGSSLIIAFALVAQMIGIVNFNYVTISSKVIFSFFLYLLVAVGEEIVVRGYILNNLREKLNDYSAILISSLVFALFHFFNDHVTVIGFLNISLSGVLMGTVLVKSNTISDPIGLHWAWNFMQGSVLGFNVSGHYEKGIFNVTPLASTILTGGNFGAEGSLVLIPITVFAIYLVWKFL